MVHRDYSTASASRMIFGHHPLSLCSLKHASVIRHELGGRARLPAMSDQPDDSEETSIQRALRLKKAAIAAKPTPPRGGKFQREQAAGIAAGKSKPWMKR